MGAATEPHCWWVSEGMELSCYLQRAAALLPVILMNKWAAASGRSPSFSSCVKSTCALHALINWTLTHHPWVSNPFFIWRWKERKCSNTGLTVLWKVAENGQLLPSEKTNASLYPQCQILIPEHTCSEVCQQEQLFLLSAIALLS